MGTYGEGETTAFPMDIDSIRPIAERFHCAVAGNNLPQQTVVGGSSDDLEKVEQAVLEQFERKRPVRLKTEGAFHTYYMVEAARHYREVLDKADFAASDIQVLSNFTGTFHGDDPAGIRSGLFFQLFHPVMWYSNLSEAFASGVDHIFEFGGGIGPGEGPESKRPNLESMIKKTMRPMEKKASYHSVIHRQSLANAVEAVNSEG